MYTGEGLIRDGLILTQWDTQNRVNGDRWRCSLRLRVYHFPVLEELSRRYADQYLVLRSQDVGRLLVVDFFDSGPIIDFLTK